MAASVQQEPARDPQGPLSEGEGVGGVGDLVIVQSKVTLSRDCFIVAGHCFSPRGIQ